MNQNQQPGAINNEESVWNRVRLCVPADHRALARLYGKTFPCAIASITSKAIANSKDAFLAHLGNDAQIEMALWCVRGGIPALFADPEFASTDCAVTAFLDLVRAAREFYPPQHWSELAVSFSAELRGFEENLKQLGFLAGDRARTCTVAEKAFNEQQRVN